VGIFFLEKDLMAWLGISILEDGMVKKLLVVSKF